jgi:aminoglycoside phosphotransferase (APT) family kinase protein
MLAAMSGEIAPIRPEERFDEGRVGAYLRAQLPGLVGEAPIEFAQFPGGRANLTYLARAGDVELVLRRPPLGPVAPGGHDMAREHAVLSRLYRAYPKAPRSFLLCTDPEVMGAPFFVMERRRGTVVREAWPRELPADDGFRRRLAENVVAALGELHTVDYRAVGLQGLGRPAGFVERQITGWVDRWERARESPVAPMEELGGWFPGAAPAPQAAVLLHNDFKLDNLMVSPGGEVAAVLDWDMATLGDPLIDLGATLAYWAEPGDALHALLAPGGAGLSDVMPRAEVVEAYATVTGFDVGDLAFYRAFGLYRVAVILQQIYARYRKGQTSDPRFAMLGAVVPLMAEEALRVAGLG